MRTKYRWAVGIFLSLVIGCIFYASLTADQSSAARLSALGQLLAAGGVLAAVGALIMQHKQISLQRTQMRAEYDWRVRQFTLELGQNWNQHTRKHLDVLSREFPAFFRVPKIDDSAWHLPKTRARQLVLCEGEEPTQARAEVDINRDRALRSHLISLLNYFESMAQAYEQKVVDTKAIEDSFSSMMIDTYDYFGPFVDEMKLVTRREPWPPLERVVAYWRAAKLREKSAQQLAIAESGSPRKDDVFPKEHGE